LEIIQESHIQYIDGNRFHHNASAGVKIHDGGGKRIYIRGNTITDNPTGLSATRSASLQIENNRINRNVIGLVLAPDIVDYAIRSNDLTGNTTSKQLGSNSGIFENNLE